MKARTVVGAFGAVAVAGFIACVVDRAIVLLSGVDHRYELWSGGGLTSAVLLGIAWGMLAVIACAACTLFFVGARAVLGRARRRKPAPSAESTRGTGISATKAATLLSLVILVLASPVILLAAYAAYVDWPRYSVESSSVSPDGRFRLDNEGASTFDRSYRRIRLVRVGADTGDRFFCEGAGGDLVGTFASNDAFVITFPDYVGRQPTTAVFSERVQFDPNDLSRSDVTLLGGASTC